MFLRRRAVCRTHALHQSRHNGVGTKLECQKGKALIENGVLPSTRTHPSLQTEFLTSSGGRFSSSTLEGMLRLVNNAEFGKQLSSLCQGAFSHFTCYAISKANDVSEQRFPDAAKEGQDVCCWMFHGAPLETLCHALEGGCLISGSESGFSKMRLVYLTPSAEIASWYSSWKQVTLPLNAVRGEIVALPNSRINSTLTTTIVCDAFSLAVCRVKLGNVRLFASQQEAESAAGEDDGASPRWDSACWLEDGTTVSVYGIRSLARLLPSATPEKLTPRVVPIALLHCLK